MNYLETQTQIKNAVQTTAGENGWANLTKVGLSLRRNGIKYGNLSKLLRNFNDIVEVKIDESLEVPVSYIRLK